MTNHSQLLSNKSFRSASNITNINNMSHNLLDVIHRYFDNEKATEPPKTHRSFS